MFNETLSPQQQVQTAPEEQKIHKARNLTADRIMYRTPSHLQEENQILKQNVADLQEQLQQAYIRIKELGVYIAKEKLASDFGEFYKERKWKK